MNLRLEHVSKVYKGGVWGLRDISLQIFPGILGLLGPNGAGKSTLMRILATITKPTDGRVTWNGTNIVDSPNELRTVLGYLPQDFGVYPNLNPIEFLEYMAAVKGLVGRESKRRIHELLQIVNLFDVRKKPLGGFSGGMKQRIGIAQALLNDPQLLIVDEPTAGLDPEERTRFRGILSELSNTRIVILSTHIVSDVEATASQIALIKRGQLLNSTTPDCLLQSVEDKVWEWESPSAEIPDLKQHYLISSTLPRTEGIVVRAIASEAPSSIARLVPPRLEDAYLYHVSDKRIGVAA
jgi:ABC-2 type transport system ATP-binding protein